MLKNEKNCSTEIHQREAVLLSIKPKYVAQILKGEKRIEFRRFWPTNSIRKVVVYSTSPIRRVVGLIKIDHVVKYGLAELFELAERLGGGVTLQELEQYLTGKSQAYGIIIGSVQVAQFSVDPFTFYPNFVAPQSYRYLSKSEYTALCGELFKAQ